MALDNLQISSLIVNQIADLQEFQVPEPVSQRIKPPRREVAKTQRAENKKQSGSTALFLCVFATWASWRFFLA